MRHRRTRGSWMMINLDSNGALNNDMFEQDQKQDVIDEENDGKLGAQALSMAAASQRKRHHEHHRFHHRLRKPKVQLEVPRTPSKCRLSTFAERDGVAQLSRSASNACCSPSENGKHKVHRHPIDAVNMTTKAWPRTTISSSGTSGQSAILLMPFKTISSHSRRCSGAGHRNTTERHRAILSIVGRCLDFGLSALGAHGGGAGEACKDRFRGRS